MHKSEPARPNNSSINSTFITDERKQRYRKNLQVDSSRNDPIQSSGNAYVITAEYLALVYKFYTISSKKVYKFCTNTSNALSTYLLNGVTEERNKPECQRQISLAQFSEYSKEDQKLLNAIDMDLVRVTSPFYKDHLGRLCVLRRIAFIISKSEKGCVYRQGLLDIIAPLYELYGSDSTTDTVSCVDEQEPIVYRESAYIYQSMKQWFGTVANGNTIASWIYEQFLTVVDPYLARHLSEINAHPMYYCYEPIVTFCVRQLSSEQFYVLMDYVFESDALIHKEELMNANDEGVAMGILMQLFPLERFEDVLNKAVSLYNKNKSTTNLKISTLHKLNLEEVTQSKKRFMRKKK
ncbi:Rab-GAP TBC domain-containing protein [Entamoeba marina]